MARLVAHASFAAIVALGCGARTEPLAKFDSDAAGGDAIDVDARADGNDSGIEADVSYDANGCPPAPVGWNESIVADDVTSYAAAADDRCGVVVVSANGSKEIDVAVRDELGVWHHSPLGVMGAPSAVAAARGAIHVTYYDGSAQRYVVQRGGVVSVPVGLAASLEHAAMVVDADDVAHVAFESNLAGIRGLGYAEIGRFQTTIDDRPAANPTMAAITWDGVLRIAYENVADPADRRCVIATQGSGAGGAFALVDLPPADGHPSSHPCTLRVPADTDSLVHLAYGADGPDGTLLRHAYGTMGALHTETIDLLASGGTDPGAAALDPEGAFRVAYHAAGSGSPLKLAVLGAGTPPVIQAVTTDDGEDLRVLVDGADATNIVALRSGRLFVLRGR